MLFLCAGSEEVLPHKEGLDGQMVGTFSVISSLTCWRRFVPEFQEKIDMLDIDRVGLCAPIKLPLIDAASGQVVAVVPTYSKQKPSLVRTKSMPYSASIITRIGVASLDTAV